MKKYIASFAILALGVVVGCQKNSSSETVTTSQSDTVAVENTHLPTGDTSENAIDWSGTYEAILPCADCPGIKTILTLNPDKTFTINEEYIDRDVKSEDRGGFSWDSTGSVIKLEGTNTKYQYKVGENQLFQLDTEGNVIDGPMKDLYILKKK